VVVPSPSLTVLRSDTSVPIQISRDENYHTDFPRRQDFSREVSNIEFQFHERRPGRWCSEAKCEVNCRGRGMLTKSPDDMESIVLEAPLSHHSAWHGGCVPGSGQILILEESQLHLSFFK
jgi:hypothetical protein